MTKIELELLTGDEMETQLCRDYWAFSEHGKFLHTVTKLADRYNDRPTRITARVARNCRVYLSDLCCNTTNCSSKRPLNSRSDYEQIRRFRRWNPAGWTCDTCLELERVEAGRRSELESEQRRTLLLQRLSTQTNAGLLLGPQSLRDTIFLVSLLRAGGSEDLRWVRPLKTLPVPLSPNEVYDAHVVHYLFSKGLICLHPGTPKESVEIEGGALAAYVPREAFWTLPLPDDGPPPVAFLQGLEESLHSSWPADWLREARALHREVALQECLRFLQIQLEEHHFTPNIGAKTTLALRSVLNHFSIGQAFNFVWNAVTRAAAFYVQQRVSKLHAVNTVPGAIQRSAERALAEGWQVKAFRRNYRAPESQISRVLFTTALKLPDGGLCTVAPAPEPDEGES
jgi:hypothetical protein